MEDKNEAVFPDGRVNVAFIPGLYTEPAPRILDGDDESEAPPEENDDLEEERPSSSQPPPTISQSGTIEGENISMMYTKASRPVLFSKN